MTIGKKLYLNFGAILAMVVVLFLINLIAVQREHSAKAAASPMDRPSRLRSNGRQGVRAMSCRE